MIGQDLIAARTLLELTPAQFAAELGVTPHVYEAWENGSIGMPRRQQQHVAYRLAAAERMRALAVSGLPHCDWVTGWKNEPPSASARAEAARYHRLSGHVQACMICRAREQFLTERFGPMPAAPVPAVVLVARRAGEIIDTLPPWSRPIAWGVLLAVSLAVVLGTLRLILSL